MRKHYILFFVLLLTSAVNAQEFSSYNKPIATQIYSEALKDTVSIEITLPKSLAKQTNTAYPILYLLDRQLQNNYAYNLYTIDYLSTLQWMPEAIVIGISFPWKNRNSWTNPNITGGQADDFIQFLEKELNNELKKNYLIADFNLLIGHSRTAIFSSYALTKSPDFFNGTIANSVANFDFGDKNQQAQFEDFLQAIPLRSHKYFYFFSVGEHAYGDLHETAVDTLNAYLIARKLPKNLEWKFYKHQVAHDVTPGVTVSNALSQIFKDYGRRIDLCFALAKQSRNKVPRDEFHEIYESLSVELGFTIQPSELFFNSIAAEYYNDYDGIYGQNRLNFTLEILQKALEKYPEDYSYYSWIGEIYYTQQNYKRGEQYLNKAIELIKADDSISEAERTNYLDEIETFKKTK